jgi:hypothetical protein
MMAVTLEVFKSYVHAKAYDVISSGHFKRHLSQCRDNGDKWAIQMYSHVNCIQNRVKDMTTLVAQLNSPHCSHIQKICKDVMSCAQPPIKVLTGTNVCSLTGVKADHCIDLTRTGKNSKEVLVHPRFWHFFVLLWFSAKLEYIVRACTKQWLESQEVSKESKDYSRLCELYTEQNSDLNERLHRLFVKGVEYITNSLTIYRDKYSLQPVLTPPEKYLVS